MAITAHTSESAVTKEFAGDVQSSLDSGVVAQAIGDAAAIVAEYDLSITGQVSKVVTGKLVDHDARFEDVESGARVRNLTKVPYTETTVNSPPTRADELVLADDIFDAATQKYWVEDLRRIELAERYKAASLVYQQHVADPTKKTSGITSGELGPMRLTFGNWSSNAVARISVENEYEVRFLEIVGPALGCG